MPKTAQVIVGTERKPTEFCRAIDKGYVRWAPSRDELEREVGTLQLAKMAVIVKGEKVRLVHDMRRDGNSKSQIPRKVDLAQVERCRARGHGTPGERG